VVWSPVAQGVLTGKYRPGEAPPAGSRATDEKSGARFISRFLDDDDLLARVQGLAPVAADLGLTMAQLAIAWVLQNENVAGAIIGASRPEQVADNVAAAGVRLDDDVRTRIDEVLGDIVQRDPGLTTSPAQRPS
jgi:aryl-alcohol dehydrogenase-like predicted oxidoreductase